MLKVGGIINIIIAIAHIIGLFWAEQMFEVTGIGEEMNQLTLIHSSLPYLLTLFVAMVFFIFGLYGLSADRGIGKLPYLKLGIFSIAGFYLLRGIGELFYASLQQEASQFAETIYSLMALGIGLLFLLGGLKKWNLKTGHLT